jgi:hypothetical protein
MLLLARWVFDGFTGLLCCRVDFHRLESTLWVRAFSFYLDASLPFRTN